MSTTLERLDEIARSIAALRDLEQTRSEKLSLEQRLVEAELEMSKALTLLRKLKPTNGTEYDDIRSVRESLTRHLSRRVA